MVIDTSKSVFDNVNSILSHFNGILRYNNGRYDLDVKSKKPDSIPTLGTSTPSVITEDDIIGTINIEDAGNKATYNSVSASIPDPQNRFEARSVTFLNSNYLKEDRNVPKKGDVKAPGITNYYHARLAAKQALEESRYSLKISFTMGPKGYLLLAGELIYVTNERLGYTQKPFRITNLSLTQDCLVQITAEEHNDEAYLVPEGDGELGNFQPGPPVVSSIGSPDAVTNLTATGNKEGGIELAWDYPGFDLSPSLNLFNPATDTYEVWRGTGPDFFGTPTDRPIYSGSPIGYDDSTAATLLATTKDNRYLDAVFQETGNTDTTEFYYWVRVRREKKATGLSSTSLFSDYFPLSTGMQDLVEANRVSGIKGLALVGLGGISVNLTNENANISVDSVTIDLTSASITNLDTLTFAADHTLETFTDVVITGTSANDGTYRIVSSPTTDSITVTPSFTQNGTNIGGTLQGTSIDYTATDTSIVATAGSTALSYNSTITITFSSVSSGLVQGDIVRQKNNTSATGTVLDVTVGVDSTTITLENVSETKFNTTEVLQKLQSTNPDVYADLALTTPTSVVYPSLIYYVSDVRATNCTAPTEVFPSPIPNPRVSIEYSDISAFGSGSPFSYENNTNAFVEFDVIIRDSEGNQTKIVKRHSIGRTLPGNKGAEGAKGA